VLQGMLSVQT